jgi:hypothetical protein
MTSIKQVTYPLLTFIINNDNYYDKVKECLLSQKVDYIVDDDEVADEVAGVDDDEVADEVAGVDAGVVAGVDAGVDAGLVAGVDADVGDGLVADVGDGLVADVVAVNKPKEKTTGGIIADQHKTPINKNVGKKETEEEDINKNVSDFYAPSFTKIEPPTDPPNKTQPYKPPHQMNPPRQRKAEEKNTGGQSVPQELRKGQFGGSIQNLRSLFASLPKPSSETPITFYNTTDIFQDNTICFHPLLPIYMITQTYMSAINNEHIEESLDFDLFVNYLNFLKKIKEKVVEIYSGENNTNINKLEAYAIGLGLKQLLFVSNNTNEGYRDCVKVLNADDNIYRSVSSLTDVLCSAICGKITHADIVLLEGPIYLNSDLFTQFARSLNVNRIFGFYVDTTNFDLSNFKAQVLEFSNELAQQIIADRNGRSTVPISSASSISAPIRSSDDVGSGLKPFDPTRVKTAKDIGFTYSSDRDLENTKKSTSSSGSISQGKGGKKSRKHKEKVKRQTRKHKKQAKNIKRKTRKHKKYAKKTRRSTSV